MKKWLFVCICLILSLRVSSSLLVEPSRFEFILNPADKTTGAIKVSNITDTPLLISVKAYDWILDTDGNLENLAFGSHPTTLSGSMKFNPKQFNLSPGQTQIVRFTLTMPAEEPKERRTMVFFETEQIASTGGIQTILQTQIGTVIYAGLAKAVASFQVLDIKKISDDINLAFDLLCLNMGEVHIRLNLTYAVMDLNGQELFSEQTVGNVILPGQNQVLHLPITKQLSPGLYKLIGKFSFDGTQNILPFVIPFTIDIANKGGLQ